MKLFRSHLFHHDCDAAKRGNGRATRLALFVAIALCILLPTGCGRPGFVYEKNISGGYALIAVDVMRQMSIGRLAGDGVAIGVVPATVFAAGWDDHFIIAKQHPDNSHERSVTNFFIIRIFDGIRMGPFDESTFEKERVENGVPKALNFTLVFDELK